MRRLIEWHRSLLDDIAFRLGLTVYQITWLAFAKGLAIGYLAGVYL